MLGIKLLIVIGITGATFLALRPIRFNREAERTTVKGVPLVLNLLVLLIAFVIVHGFLNYHIIFSVDSCNLLTMIYFDFSMMHAKFL